MGVGCYIPDRMKSETRSPIMSVVAFVLARMQSGMMEASDDAQAL